MTNNHKKLSNKPRAIINKFAYKDYNIGKIYSAGLVLLGYETKAIRSGNVTLSGSFVNIKDGELWLYNCFVKPSLTSTQTSEQNDQLRARKLLVRKKELAELITAKEQGLSLVPLKILNNKKYIKIEIATAKGLKKYDKRQKIKERETKREIGRNIKQNNY